MLADSLDGRPVAAAMREDIRDRADALATPPTLATVLASDDPDHERFVELKHEACDDVGVDYRDVRVDPDALVERVYGAVEDCSADPGVDAVFVQTPLPEGALAGVRERVAPAKDVDCFHPTNLGRLVAGDPRFVPATTAAVERLLAWYDRPVAGREVVVVGRSPAIGRPLANRLLADDATVTVCHSRTADLAAHTRRADVVVTAAGRPGLVDGAMLAPDATVVDVSSNRRETAEGVEVVGDVDAESAREVVGALTPVPGGVGPVTLAALLENVVLAAERRR